MSEATLRLLWHLLCQVRLDVGADTFEADAEAVIAARRELLAAMQAATGIT